MKKYQGFTYTDEITEIKVIAETPSYVMVECADYFRKGTFREKKETESSVVRDTPQEVFDWLLQKKKAKIQAAEAVLEQAQAGLNQLILAHQELKFLNRPLVQ